MATRTRYWYAGRSGESHTEQTKHADKDCHHLDDADRVRPISAELIDDEDTCGVCSDSFRSTDESEAEDGGDSSDDEE